MPARVAKIQQQTKDVQKREVMMKGEVEKEKVATKAIQD